MKTSTKRYIFALVIVLLTQVNYTLPAQSNQPTDELQGFKILVEKTADGIKLQGIEGCSWTDLAFNLNNDRPQAIAEYGMADFEETKKASVDSDFLFTIIRTEKGIVLKGHKGTAWTDLSFTLSNNSTQAINEMGMIDL
ncbi:hypothetical protein E1176_05025 [Fulvivirga sp. RKSG066]|uniref:hypothetical protein n=1 Tax=Fulvivirga aurantia TaxID=2529383 RepID=UPI0012BC1E9D|nr:hypothetical protein [Fulvivirga aurantia]MTI20378.1 hypothetical protein [Fulvivirga aurantia]